jgi:hypothetical protein
MFQSKRQWGNEEGKTEQKRQKESLSLLLFFAFFASRGGKQ